MPEIHLNNKLNLLGLLLDTKKEKDFVNDVNCILDGESQHMIFTPNPEMIIETRTNPEFLKVLNDASLQLPDGIGLLWASRFMDLPVRFKEQKKLRFIYALFQAFYSLLSLLIIPSFCRKIIPERVSGSDFFWKIVKLCNEKNKRIFLLGAAPGVAEKVRDKLQTVYPKIQVAGTYAGSP